jgi:hypothetical protein
MHGKDIIQGMASIFALGALYSKSLIVTLLLPCQVRVNAMRVLGSATRLLAPSLCSSPRVCACVCVVIEGKETGNK